MGKFKMETERFGITYSCRILEEDHVLFEVNNWGALSQTNNKEVGELVNRLNGLDNKLCEQQIQLDFLQAENQHMREVLEENKKLKKQLQSDIDSKRFTSKVVDWWHGVDKVRVVFDNGKWIDADTCAKLLNDLHEEKEDWKHKVGQLLFILSQFDEEKVQRLIEDLE